MITELIKIFTAPNSHVMVPFLGSGNSLLAASNAGCTAFGWDLGSEYKDAFTKRVLDGMPGSYKSYASLP
jgi:DNA modification methylase